MKINRKFLIFLTTCFTICVMLSTMSEAKGIGLNDLNDCFGKRVEDIVETVENLGYEPNPENETGILKNAAWEFTSDSLEPFSIVAWFNTEGRDVTRFVYKYSPDAELFKQIRESLNMLFGEATYQDYREERSEKRITITAESLSWKGVGIVFSIGFQKNNDGERGTLKAAEAGLCGFSVGIMPYEETNEKQPKETPEPTATAKPTNTPEPVNVEIAVEKVTIKQRNSTREFYIRLKNNSNVTIDRVDFVVIGYNRYGEQLTRYNIDRVLFYYDDQVKPGKTTPENWRYSHYLLNEATKIKIAIQKYHFIDGRTIEIPEYQLKWSTYGD